MKKVYEVHYSAWVSENGRRFGSEQFSSKAAAEKFRQRLNSAPFYKGQELYSVGKAVMEREA